MNTLYQPLQNERQFTFRAILTGCFIGSIVACTNVYIGLKLGLNFGASILCAVLSYSVFAASKNKLSVLETNIAQTSGSGAATMATAAGLTAVIPAMEMLGYSLSWQSLLLWALCIAFLGVFFAIPLRKQMIEVEQLRFPSGTATAVTILALASDQKDALQKTKCLLIAAICAATITLGSTFFPMLERPSLHTWLSTIPFPTWFPLGVIATTLATWGFSLYIGPALTGATFLIGPRVVLSLCLGAILAWGILGPLAYSQGWVTGPIMSYKNGVLGWLIWPGVAFMVSESITSFLLSSKQSFSALKKSRISLESTKEQIPYYWWMGGLCIASICTCCISAFIFQIPWYFTFFAIALSSVLTIVAVRSIGETDINPVGGIGKVVQLIFGGLAPGHTLTNLMAAGITAAGASQAADMMQDLKTGYLLQASQRKQFISQLIGICAGVVFVVPVYYVISHTYQIGSPQLPAPSAMAWKSMAELLTKGLHALPPYSLYAVLLATFLGTSIAILKKIPSCKKYMPSGLGIGIAFILPAYYSLTMLISLLIWLIWKKQSPTSCEKYTYSIASGLIAGEGIMGIVQGIIYFYWPM